MNKKRNSRLILGILLLVGMLIFVGCNKKQLSNVTIKVKNEQGEKINAQATLIKEGNEITKKVTNGLLQVKNIAPGEYPVRITKEGYKTEKVNIVVKNNDITLPITLKVEEQFDLQVEIKDEKGNKLDAKVVVTNDSNTLIKGMSRNGEFKAKDLESTKYSIQVIKEGYNNVKKDVVIKDADILLPITLEKKEVKIKSEQISQGDLSFNITDVNNNKLAAKVVIKQGDDIKQKKGSTVLFSDLATGKYKVSISRSGYESWAKTINLDQDKISKNISLKGGRVHQYLISSQDKQQKIVIENLAKDEEAIMALTYLDWANLPKEKIYEVRKKGNKLVKKYGANFAISKLDYSLGQTKQFTVPNKVKKEDITATLEAVGEHIYVFVDNKTEVKQEKIDTLVAEFDRKIYPQITGQDIKGKVVVLLSNFDNYYRTGYFDPADLYSNLGNELPMFYLNADRAKNTLLTAAAHQYQHMVFFAAKAKAGRVANDAWINQGLAQLAPQLLGYINPEKKGWSKNKGNGWVYSKKYGYLNNTTQVNLLVQDGSIPFMGGASLFVNYLIEQYDAKIIKEIITSSQAPMKVIEKYTARDFDKIYLNWVTTNLADSIEEIKNLIYNYSKFDLQQLPKLNKKEINVLGVNHFNITNQEGMIIINQPPEVKGKIGVIIIRKPKN